MTKRDEFDLDGDFEGSYDPLLFAADSYGSDNFDDLIKKNKNKDSDKDTKHSTGKRGRPVEIKDPRYKVVVPTKISKATDVKLYNLKGYMSEFREISGRISFDKIVDALAENYIKTQLPATTEKILREQIKDDFDALEK
ncbi:hypothetical protein [Enterococcus sp. 5H]|uniref:hypothetical protein n=1 Tax=Enterococcus sp. 5H TaxID=1229490 RepID=UPI0023021434|nr:hypothetical protein [Enterococcus sp. 5H]MDA9472037.1 hypothetical protein [Enterococcus sp. 5H]